MISFILGEDKHVKFLVVSRKKEPFSIRSASWKLYYDGNVENSGDCVIEEEESGMYLDIKLAPECRSRKYMLQVEYLAGDEIRKHMERMEVV